MGIRRIACPGLLERVLKSPLAEQKGVPQRLKPHSKRSIYGTAEAVPLSRTGFSATLLKPSHWSGRFLAPLDNRDEEWSYLDYQEERNIVTNKAVKEKQPETKPGDLVQGTLEMLILKTLALEPMHGYGIALRIEQISNGVFRVNPGSLLPALSRMDRAGRVKSEWRATENNRRAKYYTLTPDGRKALAAETDQWQRQISAISRILEA
jgi:transcriptional regulator